MSTLQKKESQKFPFSWVRLEYLPDSEGSKREIYLTKENLSFTDLVDMFHYLFKDFEDELLIYNFSWWDFCLDTWNPNTNEYDYTNKSFETQQYLNMLIDSNIEIGYAKSCKCLDWNYFLPIILNCIIKNIAPYSPIFYSKNKNFFFYFHSTFSIGFYYKEESEFVDRILDSASLKYNLL